LPTIVRLRPELEYSPRLNLAEVLLDAHLTARRDKVAIHHEAGHVTFGELQSRVNRLANALRELGIGPRDRVALRAPNLPEYVVCNFASWRIGAIPVLVSHLGRAREVAFKLNDSGAVAICVHSESYADVASVRDACPKLRHVIVFGERIPGTLHLDDLVRGRSEHAESVQKDKQDVGRMIYSSGTTGNPKAILTSVEGVLSLADTHGRHILNVQPDDVLGGHPSFSFAFGAGTFLYIPWRFGAAISIASHFTPERQFELIEAHGVTLLFAVPTAFRMLLGVAGAESRYDLSTLRLCQSAGESLPAATFFEWRRRFGQTILDSLGSGELNYWLSTFEGMPDDKVGSVGMSEPGFENVIVDEELNPVPPGTPGELLVRGHTGQMYWNRPDAQMKGVCPPGSRYAGWSRPGLVCVRDADGYFWHKCRADDMIVTAGYKIPGGEVEGALNNHPAVLESAVIGVPDQERGSIIKAFVVLKAGFSPSAELARELQDFVKQEIEPYKHPRLIEFAAADTLPRTTTGKIQRNALREREGSCFGTALPSVAGQDEPPARTQPGHCADRAFAATPTRRASAPAGDVVSTPEPTP
jgi:2-aminobenzoate-CoA ligase